MPIPRQRPMLFAAPMVRAILDGRKTQTRRAISPQPLNGDIGQLVCRYGLPGDQLWVRERWGYRRQFARPLAPDGEPVVYAADLDSAHLRGRAWRQSRCMPRSACRILLQINSTRVQRLQKITSADARAEGFDPDGEIADPIQWFRTLWDDLAGDNGFSWKSNPWVWVISFEVVEVAGGNLRP